MIQRRKLLIGAPALIAYAALGSPAFALEHHKGWKRKRVANELLVTLTCPITDPGFQSLLSSFNARVITAYTIIPHTYLIRTKDDAEALSLELESSGYASTVEPNGVGDVKTTPNDPYYTGTPGTGWWLDQMNCPAAWAKLQIQGLSAPLMIDMNTGAQGNHPDLTGNVLAGWDITNGTAAGNVDTFGHGTQCAGIMCALTNNGAGMASVGWGGNLFPMKIDATGSFTAAHLLSAVQYIAANISGPGVINMSFASVTGLYVGALETLWNNNFLLIGASGDAGISPCTFGPCDSPFVIGVGACQQNFSRSSYSNYGPSSVGSALGGPGAVVCAPVGAGTPSFWTTNNGSTYTAGFDGTSYSAPMVTAIASAIWSLRPDLKNWDIQNVITNPANCSATTGFTPSAPCMDYSKMIDAAKAYVAPRYGAIAAGRR